MPSCHFLCVAESAALDVYSNQWSLFHLLDALEIAGPSPPSAEKPQLLPVEVHAHWSIPPQELGEGFEWRLVTTTESGELVHKGMNALKAQSRFVRVRTFGLPIHASGLIRLQVESRMKGQGDWVRSPAAWPLLVNLTMKGTPEQAVTAMGR
jgi:hypothetical protein